jgi:hypothetical protein
MKVCRVTILVAVLLALRLDFRSALDSSTHAHPSACSPHLSLASLALVAHLAVDSPPGIHPVNISKFDFGFLFKILFGLLPVSGVDDNPSTGRPPG